MNYPQKLPYANLIMVLAILSLFAWFCLGVPGFILSCIALILYRADKKRFDLAPRQYLPQSFSKIKSGRLIALIGLIISSLYLFLIAVALISENESRILGFPWKLLR